MGLRIKLDDTILVDTPRGWDKASIKSKRGKTLKGLFLTYTSSLEFWGDGFDYIDAVMENDYCNIIKVTIETDDCNTSGEYEVEFNGIIQIPQISNYDVDQRIISTKIFDDTFDAKINNNKSLKAYVDVGTSKNGIAITAATANSISLFNPAAGFSSFQASDADGFRVFDCFKFIIDYMTDGGVGFKSDLFSGDYYNWMLFNGKELRVRNGGGDQLEVSFKDLFTELNKKANISFAIEPDDSPDYDFRLRLEETSYFEQDNAVVTLDNVPEIKMTFNKDELYSNVEIGSKSFDDDIVLSYPPINFKAFKEENYTLLGQCNIDKTLNLVSKYIIDSNVIEDVVVNTIDKYDKKIFIIVTDGSKAIKYKEYGVPVSEGISTTFSSLKLIDSGATFITDGVAIGDMLANITTGNNSTILSIDSETQVTIDQNSPVVGNNYQIRARPFSYNDPLTNIKVIERFNGGLPSSVIKHLSTSSSANFLASNTSEFSSSQSPMEFDDDSTPPNFDTGGNYDAVTNYDYLIPNNGIYGFRSSLQIRLNGNLNTTSEVTNGDFSTDTDWLYPWGEISTGKFRINFTNSTIGVGMYLKQGSVFEIGYKYLVTFFCQVTNGEIQVLGETITSDGIYQILVDTELLSTTPLELLFNFIPYNNNLTVIIDNVSVFKTPKFLVSNKIVKSTNNGSIISEYTNTQTIVFDPFTYQRDFDIVMEKTFSTFKNERITVDCEITQVSGSALASTIKTGGTFETILVDDGGGDLLPVEGSSFPIYKYKFKKALTFSEFKLLKDQPEKAILFSDIDSGHIFGWRNSIDYDRETGETKFDLRSKTKIKISCQQG